MMETEERLNGEQVASITENGDISETENNEVNTSETTALNFEDILQKNVAGIHIKKENDALNEDNPHICIGWSRLGDLSAIDSKDRLSDLYSATFIEKDSKGRSQDISQIWTFIGEIKVGDYVVYFDGKNAHIGQVISGYYYVESPENQDAGYVNNRKVKWLKSVSYKDLPDGLRNAAKSARSIYSLEKYKRDILLLLNDIPAENISEENTNSSESYAKVKKRFKEWALNRGREKDIKDSTASGYISSLERAWKNSTIVDKKETPYAYGREDIGELQAVYYLLNNNGDIADSDSKTGFKWYLDFLQDCKGEYKIRRKDKIVFNTPYDTYYARNRIIFGAPGTGKSFLLEQERKSLLENLSEDNYERVTFHPDYSYANFVGTYKPVMVMEHSVSHVDNETMAVLAVLTDKSKTAQEKYDELFDKFKDNGLTRLPLLLGLYTDESFKTRKADGTPAANNNDVEKNHGRAIRKYINLIDGNEKPQGISYEYVPGPFMRLYVKALKNAQTDNPKPYLLIIEEINRANVAAVFGDVFQLLDRDDDGVSEYAIQASEDIRKYLAKEMGGEPDDYSKIRIPNNMFIWATMNSADQGVFPMDTAFKRRWDFSYIGIDDNDTDIRNKYVYLAKGKQKVEWNKLRKAINDFLAANKINEDKQLGPYFIGRQIVVPKDGDEIDSKKFIAAFKNKVIMYLFEDAAKQKRPSLFAGCGEKGSRYSDICKEFDEKGVDIFAKDIIDATDYVNTENNAEG